jgi:glycosyltransferase involved in cell wall biosynthesis
MSPALISVIVSTYNRSDALCAVLDGLARQRDRGFEVIVADDGSRDEHVAALCARRDEWNFPLCHAWHPDVGFTLSAVRNLGVLQAQGDYLVFLDGDCIPQADFIARHRALARRGGFVIGSRILLGPALSAAVVERRGAVPRCGLRALRERLRGGLNKLAPLCLRWPARWRRARAAFRWRGIRGCNLALWHDDYTRIDGFDETFDGWGHEDADFVARLHAAGLFRIDGYWATEVLHLWHREAARDTESTNRQRVVERLRGNSSEPRAVHGLHNPLRARDDARISTLIPAAGAAAAPAAKPTGTA